MEREIILFVVASMTESETFLLMTTPSTKEEETQMLTNADEGPVPGSPSQAHQDSRPLSHKGGGISRLHIIIASEALCKPGQWVDCGTTSCITGKTGPKEIARVLHTLPIWPCSVQAMQVGGQEKWSGGCLRNLSNDHLKKFTNNKGKKAKWVNHLY